MKRETAISETRMSPLGRAVAVRLSSFRLLQFRPIPERREPLHVGLTDEDAGNHTGIL
jgi:hypothetical protein